MVIVVSVAVAVTVVAALRSTWSPCSLSMLSSMTPLTERARGHRYTYTSAWYLLGAVAGGATIGVVLAAAAAGVSVLGLGTATVAALLAGVFLVTGAADLRIGPALPIHRRQVDEDWFNRYRRWVYASGFGWQIGNGVVTYTTTTAVYAAAAAAVASGDPVFALVLGITFGTVRGAMVVVGVPLTDMDSVRRIHARLDRLSEPSRIATGLAQVAGAVTVGMVAHPALGIGVAVAAGGATATTWWRRRRRPAGPPLSRRPVPG